MINSTKIQRLFDILQDFGTDRANDNSQLVPITDLTCPPNLSNEESSIWIDQQKALHECLISYRGASIFDKRKEKAKVAAMNVGLLTNAQDVLPGSGQVTIYNGALIDLTCKKANPAKRIDITAFKSELRKAGVEQDIINECELAATKESAPATTLDFIIK